MAQVYTIVNQKGGVGKTTTAINLGAYLGELGFKVLLIDLDPQANATSCLGVDKRSVKASTYEVLLGHAPIDRAILHNSQFKLSLLPSKPSLSGAEVELIEQENRDRKMLDAINTISEKYDYILIDCPPSLSLLTVNGLIAALHGVIIPVQCEYLALEGLGQLTTTIDHVRSTLFPELRIHGVLMTMYDGRTNLAIDVVKEVRNYFGDLVFQTLIPRSIRLAEAPSYGMPISIHAPNSAAALAYRNLAEEIARQDGKLAPAFMDEKEEMEGTV